MYNYNGICSTDNCEPVSPVSMSENSAQTTVKNLFVAGAAIIIGVGLFAIGLLLALLGEGSGLVMVVPGLISLLIGAIYMYRTILNDADSQKAKRRHGVRRAYNQELDEYEEEEADGSDLIGGDSGFGGGDGGGGFGGGDGGGGGE